MRVPRASINNQRQKGCVTRGHHVFLKLRFNSISMQTCKALPPPSSIASQPPSAVTISPYLLPCSQAPLHRISINSPTPHAARRPPATACNHPSSRKSRDNGVLLLSPSSTARCMRKVCQTANFLHLGSPSISSWPLLPLSNTSGFQTLCRPP